MKRQGATFLLCRQLYAGIAELAGLTTEAPEQVLLLCQFNTSSGDAVVYDDLKVGAGSGALVPHL